MTGIIISAGTFGGQQLEVYNESNFSLTFDVAGTSHVAGGTSAFIPPNGCAMFRWDNGTNLWYPCNPGQIAPLIIAPEGIIAGGSSAALTANTVYLYKFVQQVGVTVTGMLWKATTTAAGNVNLGIYSGDGNTLLGSTGSVANTTTNNVSSAALSGGNLYLPPGVYYLAMTVGSASDTFTRTNNLGSAGHPIVAVYTATNNSTGTTSPVLPSTLGGVTMSAVLPALGAYVVGGI